MTRRQPDGLGLERALGGGVLPVLVAAMALLAALAVAGSSAAAALAGRWQAGAGGLVTIQVPQPDAPAGGDGATRGEAVLRGLAGQAGVARRLGGDEVAALLRPWLGDAAAGLVLPGVIELRLTPEGAAGWSDASAAALAGRLQAVAAGTLVERNAGWLGRLAALARSLQLCAGACLVLVVGVGAAVVGVATRAGLASRRAAIGIVHGLGATDGYIAGRFARRAARLAVLGGALGTVAALPVLLGLAGLALPFADPGADPGADRGAAAGAGWLMLPARLWGGLAVLPPAAGVIGWLTAQATVRRWLRRLP